MRVFRQPGPLDSARAPLALQPLTRTGQTQTIYRFGQDVEGEDRYWFEWGKPVQVVRGFVHQDTGERTYWTGDGIPRATDNEMALSGGGDQYPAASYMLGLPVPEAAPICENDGGQPAEDELAETRVYTYTWVNSWGEESAPFAEDPMPGSVKVEVTEGQDVRITLPEPPSGPHNITKRRIYRSTQGSGFATYLFVAEIDVALAEYVDSTPPDELGEECPSITWDPPKEDLSGLIAMANGILAGFSGHDVYFSEPFRPFAWPVNYMVSVGHPIVGLGSMDTTLAVLTTAKPYFVQGGHPDSMTMVEGNLEQSCVAPRSIVSMGGAVIYASPDGLVQLSPSGSGLLTQALFERDQWQALNPESMHAYAHDGKYIAFYDTGSERGSFVLDPATKTFTFHDVHAVGGYADLRNDVLYLSDGDNLLKWDSGDKLPYVWRSKQFTLAQPTGFAALQVESEHYPVEVDVFRDGALHHGLAIESMRPVRLPPGKGRMWEVEVRGTAQVFRVGLAESPLELANG